MNNNFLPYQLKKTNDSNEALASQLAENAKKTAKYIALTQYCVGDGVTDDTTGFLNAIAYAKSNGLSILVDGIFLIKQGITIENGTIPEFFGNNRGGSVLLFDIDGTTAITAQTYYTSPLRFRHMSIKLKDNSKTASGLKVNFNSWGGAVLVEDVSISNFTDIIVNIVEGYGSHFENVQLIGGQRSGANTAKILKIDKGGSFSNVNSFKGCTFQFGRMGIQNLGGLLFTFDTCDFESLDLFLHMPNFTGYTLRKTFKNCWFELVNKGIINADITETTLTINTPLSNYASLDGVVFQNNYEGPSVTNRIDQTAEPNRYNNFFFVNGFSTSQLIFTQITLNSGWTGSFNYAKNPNTGMVTVYGSAKPTVSGSFAPGQIVNALPIPVGFRPLQSVSVALLGSPDGAENTMFYLTANGNLTVPMNNTNFTTVYSYIFNFNYYAG